VTQRIDRCFDTARVAGRKVLIPFITAGDPRPEWTVELMHALVAAGADLIELGIPFSDPMADGPVIQASSERAVQRGVGVEQVLEWVQEFRQHDTATPVVLMGYMNPFERIGYHDLAARTAAAGVDGLLLVDCPPEEMPELQGSLEQHEVYAIRLVAPTTTAPRLEKIAAHARGFIYYVSFKGTTGAAHLDVDALAEPVSRLRSACSLPVAVGFGIRDAESAVAVATHADGVVIGSALVGQLASLPDCAAARSCIEQFIGGIREALDQSVTMGL
jgi:tryptophan synthase alpha chain